MYDSLLRSEQTSRYALHTDLVRWLLAIHPDRLAWGEGLGDGSFNHAR